MITSNIFKNVFKNLYSNNSLIVQNTNFLLIQQCNYAFGSRISRTKQDLSKIKKRKNSNDRNKSLLGKPKSLPKTHTDKVTKDIRVQDDERVEMEEKKLKSKHSKKLSSFSRDDVKIIKKAQIFLEENEKENEMKDLLEDKNIYTEDGLWSCHKIITEQSGMRIDRWISHKFPILTHIAICKWIEKGKFMKSDSLDGKRIKFSEINERTIESQWIFVPSSLPKNQKIADIENPKKNIRLSDQDIKSITSSILYKDDHLIIINKPQGLSVQGGTGLVKHLDMMLSHLKFELPDPPKLVHRLDKDTSGIMVLARNRHVASLMATKFEMKLKRSENKRDKKNNQFQKEKSNNLIEEKDEEDKTPKDGIIKTYWALLSSTPLPGEGRIKAPLKKVVENGKEKVVTTLETGDGAKLAITEYKVVESLLSEYSFVELTPETGRTHQLRVHCASILKSPIVGDNKYGNSLDYTGIKSILETSKIPLHLHARRLRFYHPISEKLMDITAPLPKDLEKSWISLGFKIPKY